MKKKTDSDPVLVDLSHTIFDGLITYKGLPAPIICDFLSRETSRQIYKEGTEFQIAKIEMVANTGTYMDCPFHRYENGRDFSQIDVAEFVDIEGIAIDAKNQTSIGKEYFEGHDLRNKAVIVYTDWSRHWNTESYFEGHSYLTEDAAVYLRDSGVRLVGIDSLNIDSIGGKDRPVHTILLGANILIVEHLTNLAGLPGKEFYFSAVPPKIKGMGSFPVRAYATL